MRICLKACQAKVSEIPQLVDVRVLTKAAYLGLNLPLKTDLLPKN
jgi:hypothetical protein